jgi:hypothetical protein
MVATVVRPFLPSNSCIIMKLLMRPVPSTRPEVTIMELNVLPLTFARTVNQAKIALFLTTITLTR